jgi:DNA-binding NtrC family response regulator/tetratricopeptide (TPR) repeat protein
MRNDMNLYRVSLLSDGPRNRSEARRPSDMVPAAELPVLAEARGLLHQGNVEQALSRLETLFCSSGLWTGPDFISDGSQRREAALLKAWCLIGQKQHAEAELWLETACRNGHLPLEDAGARVIILNRMLCDEKYTQVQLAAEELLNEVTDPADRNHAELRLVLGASLRWQGKLNESVGHLEFACSAFTVLNVPGRAAVAVNFLGWTQLSRGRLDESRRWFEKSLDINTALGARLRMAQNYQNLAIVCYKQGDYGLAIELLEKELGEVTAHPDMTCRAQIALGNVLRMLGEFMTARTALLKAFALAEDQGLAREQILALEFLGDIFRDEGNFSEARTYYDRAMALARPLAPRGDLVGELLRREGECLDHEGRHEEAHQVLSEALEVCKAVGDRFEIAVTRRCLGVNTANLGRWKSAGQLLENALVDLRALAARYEIMIACHRYAQVLVRRIDSGQFVSGKMGTRSGRLLEEAWNQALVAQQLNQELEIPHLREETTEMVSGLARRRLLGQERPVRPVAFSARRAPATRIVAVSAAMQHVVRRCDGFARYDSPILIRGERGTAKHLLARRTHENSPRGAMPFVSVSCASASPEILARELFGQTATASSGIKSLPGLVSQAEGGTLYLRDIEALPRQVQGKLLRLIQENIYRPVGDSRERLANVRIIVSTTADLAGLADDGAFQPNLYFRLKIMSVEVAPLRARAQDIIPVLDHFLTRLEDSPLEARAVFDFQGLETMVGYRWPGNTAEVEAVAQQAWVARNLGRSVSVRMSERPQKDRLEIIEGSDAGSDINPGHPSGMTWTSLNSLIDRSGGNKAKVARNLGISRITLYRWLKQLDPEMV